MARKNIFLCGFMGCGKTTVGQELAWRIFYDYVDMDQRIEDATGLSIPQIFELKGEDGFRDLESKMIEDLCGNNGQVISTGGGALLRKSNADIARKNGRVVLINSEFSLCYDRIKDSDRPIVQRSTREELEQLYNERLPVYQSVCDFEVFNQRSPKDAAKAILTSLL